MGELAMKANQLTKVGKQPNRRRKSDPKLFLRDFQDRGGARMRLLKRQHLREIRCACNLRDRLSGWVDREAGGQEPWEASMRQVAAELAKSEGGPDLLTVLGESYQTQARRYLATERAGPLSLAGLAFSVQLVWLRVKRQTTFARKAVRNIAKVMWRVRADAKKLKKQQVNSQEKQRRFAQAAMKEALPSVLDWLGLCDQGRRPHNEKGGATSSLRQVS